MPRILWDVRLSEIAGLLGTATGSLASLAAMRLEALRKRTREQLLEVARKLDLAGVSKLSKDELAARVLGAIKKLAAEKPAKAKAARPRGNAGKGVPAKGREKASGAKTPPRQASAKKGGAGKEQSREATPEERAYDAGVDPSATAKLDLGPAARAEKPVEHVPWGYEQDRLVAAAVDPDRLFVYWEVTDPAMERARAGLGPGGPGAWLSLRVYDTTNLIFDGTNAHSYFDQQVERSDRQWFFAIDKPGSTAHVELGMKSAEGYFITIARSGRVDFPRKAPAVWSEPEWLTVLPDSGELRGAGIGGPFRGLGGGPPPRIEPPPPFVPIALWRIHEFGAPREALLTELLEAGWERVEWQESQGQGSYELKGRVEWQGPVTRTTWEAGPFAYPVEVDPPEREEWRGPTFAFKLGGITHVVFGPWEVVIRNLGAHQGRAVLGRWEIYRSWVAEGGREIRVPGQKLLRIGASELVGASERRWLSASELRLGGASELWRLGASELRLRGASEILFAGASERLLAGASERRLLGASELRLGGASERLGASEVRLGASENRPSYPKVEE